MKIRSLRTRLVLISTLVSGVVITCVSVLAWTFLVRSARESVDLKLEGISGRLIRDMHPRMDGRRMAQRVKITHGDDIENSRLILHLRDDINDGVIYTSLEDQERFFSKFPPELRKKPADSRPRPEFAMEPPARLPGGKRKDGRPPVGPSLEKGKGFEPLRGKGPPMDEGLAGTGPLDQQYATVTAFGKEWRVIVSHERGYFVLAAVDLTDAIAGLRKLERWFIVGIPVAIALIGLGGWLVVERAMKPVREIAEAAAHINASDLSARIEGSRNSDPEFEHLVDVLNGMMERLELGFSHANRFSADVSHELKTPITVMQGEIESALRSCEPGTEEEDRLIVLREETNRLKSITRSLMLLSQADVGELIQHPETIELSDELQELVEDAEVLSSECDVEIQSAIDEGISVEGDVTLMRQAFLNLINNAIKYNKEGGYVRISLSKGDEHALIEVENSGEGIPEDARAKVFDRFYRTDESRSRQADGYGLGLSLTQAIIHGHGGTICLEDGGGKLTKFAIHLPISTTQEDERLST